jgi:hypothetical protein
VRPDYNDRVLLQGLVAIRLHLTISELKEAHRRFHPREKQAGAESPLGVAIEMSLSEIINELPRLSIRNDVSCAGV